MHKVSGAVLRDETIRRLGGDGDNFYMTWTADDSQLLAVCDGTGFPGIAENALYNSHLYRMSGNPSDVTFHDVPGYPRKVIEFPEPKVVPRYYGFGTIAVEGCIYQYMSTLGVRDVDGMSTDVFVGAKLIFSPDGGVTWHNQDGSTPVVFESLNERSRDSLVFYDEPGHSFALPAILQMGRDYRANRDGFVYVYAPNGITKTTMNELVMFRVPKDRILDRSAYEYFAGFDGQSPSWSHEIRARRPTQVFPEGYVTRRGHPYSWQPSVVYNEPLNMYLMTSWGMAPSSDDWWFTKPSYLGFWTASDPWGPWVQIHEDAAWTPGGDDNARCYQPQIAPKWISADGTSFWLAWTDFQPRPGTSFAEEQKKISALDGDEFMKALATLRPFYALNVQRVDLVLD